MNKSQCFVDNEREAVPWEGMPEGTGLFFRHSSGDAEQRGDDGEDGVPKEESGEESLLTEPAGGTAVDDDLGEVIGDRGQIIVDHHLLPGRFMFEESVDVLRQVEHDDDDHEQRHGEEEGADEFL